MCFLKKKIVTATIICILAVPGCGGGSSASDSSEVEQKLPLENLTYADLFIVQPDITPVNGSNAKPLLVEVLEAIDQVEYLANRYSSESYDRLSLAGNTATSYGLPYSHARSDACATGQDEYYESTAVIAGEPEATIAVFNDCEANGLLLDGAVKALYGELGRETLFGDMRYTLRHDDTDITVNGGILLFRNPSDSAGPSSTPLWEANLEIVDHITGDTITVSSLRRTGMIFSSYTLTGHISNSSLGSIALDFNSEDLALVLTGKRSYLNLDIDHRYWGSDEPLLTDYNIYLDANGDGQYEQSVTQYVEDLLSDNQSNSDGPLVSISGDSLLSIDAKGQYSVSISQNHNQFFHVTPHIDTVDASCDATALIENIGTITVQAACPGNYVLHADMTNGYESASDTIALRVHKPIPDASIQDVPVAITTSDSFSASTSIANANYGPYIYGNAFGIGQPSINQNGIFSWNGVNEIFSPSAEVDGFFGFSITNDLTAMISFTTPVTISGHRAPLFIPNTEAEGNVANRGAVDLEPNSSNGDIAFIRGKSVYKYSKSTDLVRKVDVVLPGRGLNNNGLDRSFDIADVNNDGISDFTMGYPSEIDGGAYGFKIFSYDLQNERTIFHEAIYTGYPSGYSPPEVTSIQIHDFDGDGKAEYIFLVPGNVSFSPIGPGIYSYASDTGMFSVLYEFPKNTDINALSILDIHDTDSNGDDEYYVATRTQRAFVVFKLHKTEGKLALSARFEKNGYLGNDLMGVMFHDKNGDDVSEIVVFDDGWYSCIVTENSGSVVLTLDNTLSLIDEKQLDFQILSGTKLRPEVVSPGVYALTSMGCESWDSGFGVFNPINGQRIWMSSARAHLNTPNESIILTPDSATYFIGVDGEKKLAVGGLKGVYVLRSNSLE